MSFKCVICFSVKHELIGRNGVGRRTPGRRYIAAHRGVASARLHYQSESQLAALAAAQPQQTIEAYLAPEALLWEVREPALPALVR